MVREEGFGRKFILQTQPRYQPYSCSATTITMMNENNYFTNYQLNFLS